MLQKIYCQTGRGNQYMTTMYSYKEFLIKIKHSEKVIQAFLLSSASVLNIFQNYFLLWRKSWVMLCEKISLNRNLLPSNTETKYSNLTHNNRFIVTITTETHSSRTVSCAKYMILTLFTPCRLDSCKNFEKARNLKFELEI